MGMSKCGDCLYFGMCSHYVDAEETFPEVGGCRVFKRKDAFVQVVRCKDCEYWFAEELVRCKMLHAEPYGWCCRKRSIIETDHTDITQHDDFCSYGERKDNERKAD